MMSAGKSPTTAEGGLVGLRQTKRRAGAERRVEKDPKELYAGVAILGKNMANKAQDRLFQRIAKFTADRHHHDWRRPTIDETRPKRVERRHARLHRFVQTEERKGKTCNDGNSFGMSGPWR